MLEIDLCLTKPKNTNKVKNRQKNQLLIFFTTDKLLWLVLVNRRALMIFNSQKMSQEFIKCYSKENQKLILTSHRGRNVNICFLC